MRKLLLVLGLLSLTNLLMAQEARFITKVRRITFEGKRSGEGYFSADGKQMVFQSERSIDNPFYQIYSLDFESAEVKRISPGYGKTTCSFFQPKTGRIMFSSTHLDPNAKQIQKAELEFRASGKKRRYAWDYDSTMDVFSADENGTAIKRLTKEIGYDAEGAYSPDGQWIVFCSNRNAYNRKLSEKERSQLLMDPSFFADLFIMKADGSMVKQITKEPGYDGGCFFSPDGKRVIYRHFNLTGEIADVWTMNTDGSDKKQITDFKCMSWAPYYHPSNKYVVFTANKLGFDNFELFIADVQGKKEPVRVTFTPGFDGLPVFTPDGKSLSWTSNRTNDGSSQIYLASWNHDAALEALNEAPELGKVSTNANNPLKEVKASEAYLKAWVERLAHDSLEGRQAGSSFGLKAAKLLAGELQKMGYKPLPSLTDYLVPFSFVRSVEPEAGFEKKPVLRLLTAKNRYQEIPINEARAYVFSEKQIDVLNQEMVFTGFGLQVKGMHAYSSYSNFKPESLKGKIAVVLEGLPENLSQIEKQWLKKAAEPYNKALAAKEAGAVGIIFIKKTTANNPLEGGVAGDFNFKGDAGIPAIQWSLSSLEKFVKTLKADKYLEEAKKYWLETPAGFTTADSLLLTLSQKIKPLQVSLSIKLNKVKVNDFNVVGYLPAAYPNDSTRYLSMGAHFDHLGRGAYSSMETKSEKLKEIHNGADDNASGTATVLELAKMLAEHRKQRPQDFYNGLVVGFWSAEELGLLGSEAFAKTGPLKPARYVANLNFDMTGRLKNNKLIFQATGSSPVWKKLIEKHNLTAGFDVDPVSDPFAPSDGTSFYQAGIPALNIFTGLHEQYHRPTDDIELINYEGMVRITDMSYGLALDLLKMPERPQWLKADAPQSVGRTGNLYLGTMPDYGADVKGMKLAGVREGGPASLAGLKEGDIIIELGSKPVNNIHDYMSALDGLTAGKPAPIKVDRNGQKLNLEVVPTVK